VQTGCSNLLLYW